MSKLDGVRDTRLYRMGVAVAVAASLLTLIARLVEQDTAATARDMQHAFESLVRGGPVRPMS